MKPPALIQKGDVMFKMNKAYSNERVWITVEEPGGSRLVDVGILVNSDGLSIDVWPHTHGEAEEPSLSMWDDWAGLFPSEDYLKHVSKCGTCEERWCDKCKTHWADCDCPGPHPD